MNMVPKSFGRGVRIATGFLLVGGLGAGILGQTPAEQAQVDYEKRLGQIIEIAGIKPDMIIGEVGSGSGDLAARMARVVGKGGKVYANDIAPSFREYIDKFDIPHLVAVLGKTDDPLFPESGLDLVIMKNTFHDLEKPLNLLENLKKYLKRNAVLIVLEPLRTPASRKSALSFHQMTKDQLLALVMESSFKPARPEIEIPQEGWAFFLAEDAKPGASIETRRIAWERTLNSYRDDAPDTDEDEQLRTSVEAKIADLKARTKPLSPAQVAVRLRSVYRDVDDAEFENIWKGLGFLDGFRFRAGDFPNEFEPVSSAGDPVVIDHHAGLMWHPGSSEEPLDFFAAQNWIAGLNLRSYAGYSDWRLPTLEELLTLIETEKTSGDLRIDPAFSSLPAVLWTGDGVYPGRAWAVNFTRSYSVTWDILKTNLSWVRPVRCLTE